MRIVVTSSGTDLDAPASPIFGRCRAYVFVDTESMETTAVENPAVGSASGAGIQAAQFVIQQGAQAVITGNMGPNAFSVFRASGVPIYPFEGGTGRQAVEAFKAGQLQSVADATTQAGMGMGPGGVQPGTGMGRGRGRGMGMGRGRRIGMGQGGWPGAGRGRGAGMGAGMQPGMTGGGVEYGAGRPAARETSAPQTKPSRGEEIAALKETAQELQSQLAQVLERLEQLQEGT